MCGIAGNIRFNCTEPKNARLIQASNALKHRGPDDHGVLFRQSGDHSIGLAHRRLAIIDLKSGQQPFTDPAETISVTFNGEIYNYKELKAELIGKDHQFRTQSDTEVLLHSWKEWGEDCLPKLRGMFAFALVDWKERKLFLARDPFGIKPLCYFADDDQFGFASEIPALTTLRSRSSGMDIRSLDQYLFLGYIPAPRTIFKGIKKLQPAHCLAINFDGTITSHRRYWSLDYRPKHGKSLSTWVEEAESILQESVQAHLVSDVPVGAFLSGGIDSSLVVSMMAAASDHPVHTYSIGFSERSYDESPYARAVAENFSCRHLSKNLQADAQSVLPQLVRHFGEPFGDWSALPTFFLAQLAGKDHKVVLSGDGGDELFAGYNRYFDWMDEAEHTRNPTDDWRKRMLRCMDLNEREKLWRSEYLGEVGLDVEALSAAEDLTTGLSRLNRAQAIDRMVYLPDSVLTKVDIASMMNSLEVRTPFLDIKVAEFSATLPEEFLIESHSGAVTGKKLLKQLMKKQFPNSFLNRRKTGFVPPFKIWFDRNSPARPQWESVLSGKDAKLAEYLRPEAVRDIVQGFDRTGYAEPVWALLFLEIWLKQQVAGDTSDVNDALHC
jgi:asparagine synthase (glutamine-hydrolysing)